MTAMSSPGGREVDASNLAVAPTHRQMASVVAGAAGLLAYNWWVLVPFRHGLMPSTDGFFSDLEVNGRPDAALMSHLDLAAGVLILTALLLSGPAADRRPRREWLWLVGFGLAGASGGLFHYACSEGLSASCRQAERNLELPLHHYLHIVSGVAEFATITFAARRAERRTRSGTGPVTEAYRMVALLLVVGYPLLAVSYLSDRMGAYVEPMFFVAFTLLILTELLEPLSAPPVIDLTNGPEQVRHPILDQIGALAPMAGFGRRRESSSRPLRPIRWSRAARRPTVPLPGADSPRPRGEVCPRADQGAGKPACTDPEPRSTRGRARHRAR